jgi:hypothetical protein
MNDIIKHILSYFKKLLCTFLDRLVTLDSNLWNHI